MLKRIRAALLVLRGKDPEHEEVRCCYRKYWFLNYTVPGHLTQRKLRERLVHLQEELAEFEAAIETQDLEQQIDALIDLVYIAKGTSVMLGTSWRRHWLAVHQANLAKIRGVSSKRGFRTDIIKPEGWRPPDHRGVLTTSGYDWARYYSLADDCTISDSRCRDDDF